MCFFGGTEWRGEGKDAIVDEVEVVLNEVLKLYPEGVGRTVRARENIEIAVR